MKRRKKKGVSHILKIIMPPFIIAICITAVISILYFNVQEKEPNGQEYGQAEISSVPDWNTDDKNELQIIPEICSTFPECYCMTETLIYNEEPLEGVSVPIEIITGRSSNGQYVITQFLDKNRLALYMDNEYVYLRIEKQDGIIKKKASLTAPFKVSSILKSRLDMPESENTSTHILQLLPMLYDFSSASQLYETTILQRQDYYENVVSGKENPVTTESYSTPIIDGIAYREWFITDDAENAYYYRADAENDVLNNVYIIEEDAKTSMQIKQETTFSIPKELKNINKLSDPEDILLEYVNAILNESGDNIPTDTDLIEEIK